MATPTDHRPAGDRPRVAPPSLPVVLEVEEPSPHRTSADSTRRARADSYDVRGEPALGRSTIHGELLKLGLTISQASVATYMVRGRRPPSQPWRTFLTNHKHQLIAADFFVVPTVTYRLLFVLVLLAHDRRRIVHLAVTARPTAAWTAQQLGEACPWDSAPRYLLRDRDHAFGELSITAKAMGIREVLTAAGSPWQ